jgi:hypothetical protein
MMVLRSYYTWQVFTSIQFQIFDLALTYRLKFMKLQFLSLVLYSCKTWSFAVREEYSIWEQSAEDRKPTKVLKQLVSDLGTYACTLLLTSLFFTTNVYLQTGCFRYNVWFYICVVPFSWFYSLVYFRLIYLPVCNINSVIQLYSSVCKYFIFKTASFVTKFVFKEVVFNVS